MSTTRRRRLLGLCLLAAAPALPAAATVRTGTSAARLAPGPEAPLVRLSRALRREPDAPGALEAEVRALGPEAPPALLGLLDAGELAIRSPEGEALPLDATQEELLLDATAAAGRGALLPLLREREAPRSPRAATVTLRVLARVGTRRELVPALAVAGGCGDSVPRAVRSAFEAATAAIVEREPGALGEVRRLFLDTPPVLAASLARAVGAAGVPGALETLGYLVGFDEDLDPVVLTELGSLARRMRVPLDDEVASRVRSYLERAPGAILSAAILTAGRAGDFQAAPRLVELLDDDDEGVRRNAHWALVELSGLRLDARPRLWRSWLAGEEAWLGEEAPRLFAELDEDDPACATRALSALSVRHAHRHLVAHEVERSIDHRDATVRRLVCVTLGRLGVRTSVEPLRRLLEDEDVEVAAAAREALVLLGELPPASDEEEREP